MEYTLEFTLNGKPVALQADPAQPLLHLLREQLGLTGTKEGCGAGECGACTVLLNGAAVASCLVPAGQVAGATVVTIEGLGTPGEPDPLQRAFVEQHAIQCGFCTPGMVMAAKALLVANPHPTEEQIRAALAGHLCRCTGYESIVRAVEQAARQSDK